MLARRRSPEAHDLAGHFVQQRGDLLGGVMALTGITLASNLGTFVLYALICGLTVVAFAGTATFSFFKHGFLPILGLIVNLIMISAIFIIGVISGGATAQATYLALGIRLAGWC